ncbi:MAG: FHA domain-containing protein [Anaerolineae bacterium]|jgi:pSer/pThr/pTyr-binding forkhead associated (FHA) protein|nr:FHA domain-containing protein [Anaerolineae bacterium]
MSNDTNLPLQDTRKLSEAEMTAPEYHEKIAATMERIDTVSLILPGNDKPLIFRDQETVIIGRRDENNQNYPDVDLSHHFGMLMGVSRRHAEIKLSEGQCYLRDLNSANGTWLSERKLIPEQYYPLHNGAQIRLGQLLILVFLSQSSQIESTAPTVPERPQVTMIYLTDREHKFVEGVSLVYVHEKLAHYLNAIQNLQRHLREIQGKPRKLVSLRSLRFNSRTESVEIELTHVAEIVDFLQHKLPTFVRERQLEHPLQSNFNDATVRYLCECFEILCEVDYLDRFWPSLEVILNSSVMMLVSPRETN